MGDLVALRLGDEAGNGMVARSILDSVRVAIPPGANVALPLMSP